MEHPINLDTLTPEEAIQATIDMWSDMKETLGDDLNSGLGYRRYKFKKDWLEEHKYGGIHPVECACFLCHYADNVCRKIAQVYSGSIYMCDYCPIRWPESTDPATHPGCTGHHVDYQDAPLSDILEYLKDESNWRGKEEVHNENR